MDTYIKLLIRVYNKKGILIQTERYRNLGMNKSLVVIEDSGEYAYCLDTTHMRNNECPVIVWNRQGGLDDDNTAKNF